MEFKITNTIMDEDKQEIFEGLLEYNLSRIEDKNPMDLGIYLEVENGHKIAGLIGVTHGNWLTVKYLWVSKAMRGQKIGSQILKKAEKEAKDRGCRYVFLDTFSFQAPDFYRKQGYQEVFALEEYPVTGKRYYFTKKL